MNDCEKALEAMNSYIDGNISDDDREFLMSHIASCPECSEIFGILTGMSGMFSEDAEPPEALLSGVMEGVRAINAENKTVSISRSRRMMRRWVSIAACAVAAVSLGAFAARSLPGTKSAALESSNETESVSADAADAQLFSSSASSYSLAPETSLYSDSVEDSAKAAVEEHDAESSIMPESNDTVIGITGMMVSGVEAEKSTVETDTADEDEDYAYFSANCHKILYADTLPESLSDAEALTTDSGTEYYEITDEELDTVVEELDASGAFYELLEIPDTEQGTIAVVMADRQQ